MNGKRGVTGIGIWDGICGGAISGLVIVEWHGMGWDERCDVRMCIVQLLEANGYLDGSDCVVYAFDCRDLLPPFIDFE